MAGARGKWADRYRDRWTWDKVTWGSHEVDCYPGGCSFRVYTRDGKILREEQSGTLRPIEAGIPDNNPMGCQKGACWSHCHYSPDRVTAPLKRVGERGELGCDVVGRAGDEHLGGGQAALGELLRRSGDKQYAMSRLLHYRQATKPRAD